jgi:hypothetical protein
MTYVESNVKELPEKGAKIVAQLKENIEATIIENTNYYYKVTFTDEDGVQREGYVAKRNLKIIKEPEAEETEEKIEGQKDGEKSLADQYRRLQQIRDTIENKNYNEQAILEILYGCVEVIEIHNNGDMDVTMSRELMRSKFELYSIVESDYSLFHFSFTYKKETIYDRNRKAYNEKVLELIRSEKYITIPAV